MDHHRLAVGAALHIQFHHIRAQFGRFAKAGQGVMRRIRRRAAVANAQAAPFGQRIAHEISFLIGAVFL